MEDALNTLAASGPLGAACVILAFVVWYLWREGKEERAAHARERKELEDKIRELEGKRLHDIREAMQQRIADAEVIHRQMLEVVKQCTTVMETTSASLEGHRDATLEHRDAQKEAAEELRKLSTLLTTLNDELKHRLRPPVR